MSGKPRKRSRGRAYPGHSLPQAVELLSTVQSQLGDGPFSREAIAEAMGQSLSGSAMVKIGAMTHFGLLMQKSGAYEVTDQGHSVLHPTNVAEKSEALEQAVRSPALYADLFSRYEGKPLPKLLSNILMREFGIASNAAEKCRDIFLESAESVGLLRNGVLLERPNLKANEDEDSQNPKQENSHSEEGVEAAGPNLKPQFTNNSSGPRVYNMPLSGDRQVSLSLPVKVDSADIAVIRQWIGLMEGVLVKDSIIVDPVYEEHGEEFYEDENILKHPR